MHQKVEGGGAMRYDKMQSTTYYSSRMQIDVTLDGA